MGADGEPIMKKVRRLLGGLRMTPKGEVLHGLIDRLRTWQETCDLA